MRKIFYSILCALMLLVSVSPGNAQNGIYFGRVEAGLTLAMTAMSDSLDARLDSLDTTWRLWSRINGSEKDATHGWFSDKNLGLFRFGENRMGITAGGTSRAIIDSNGVSAFAGLRIAPSQYSDYADSALTFGLSSGVPIISLFGTDGDTGYMSMDTSDRMLFKNFSGGYDFDVDPSVSTVTAWIDSGNIADGAVSNVDLRDDAVTGSKIQASAIDSTDVKNTSLAIGDIAALQNRLDEKQAKSAFNDSATAALKRAFFPRRLAFPTMKDSLITGTAVVCLNDSIWDEPYMLTSAWPDSGLFHRAYNEAAGGQIDTLTVGIFDHLPAANDSFVVYVRTDEKDSASVDITIKGADGTVALSATTVTPTVENAWERFVYYRSNAVVPKDYLITYRYRCYAGHYLDITPVTAKCAN